MKPCPSWCNYMFYRRLSKLPEICDYLAKSRYKGMGIRQVEWKLNRWKAHHKLWSLRQSSMFFSKFAFPFNLVTDSFYVAGVVERAKGALRKTVSNNKLHDLLKKLIFLLSFRKQPYFITHIRLHTSLPGFMTEGNTEADLLTIPIETTVLNILEQARISHIFYHQNAPALTLISQDSRSKWLWVPAQIARHAIASAVRWCEP